jgi:uncharacterized membrane protein YeiH
MLKGDGGGDGSGAHCAMLAGLDLLGCVIVGVTTAVGGGTFRDVVLGKQAFWVRAAQRRSALVDRANCE